MEVRHFPEAIRRFSAKGLDQERPWIWKAGVHLRRKSKRILQNDANGDPRWPQVSRHGGLRLNEERVRGSRGKVSRQIKLIRHLMSLDTLKEDDR